jgi:uncharacterized protein
VIAVVATLGSLLSLPFLSSEEISGLFDGGGGENPLPILATSLVAQQLIQVAWPFLVSKWKGLGARLDWRIQIKAIDLLIGLGSAIMAFGLAALTGGVAATLVGLADENQADNTQFLRDAEGTPWLYVFLLGAVIGAPLSEEILFRGLVLRAFEKRAGLVAGVIGSTALFTVVHYIGGSADGTVVLFASIASVGLVLAVTTAVTNRLGPAIIAHVLFNAVGSATALGLFGDVPA